MSRKEQRRRRRRARKENKVRNNVYNLIEICSRYTKKVEINKFCDIYKEYYGKTLSYQCFGFTTLESFLTKVKNYYFSIKEEKDKIYVMIELPGDVPLRFNYTCAPIPEEEEEETPSTSVEDAKEGQN